jgi:O-antigen ligase
MTEWDTTYYCRSDAGTIMKLATITESVSYLDKHYSLANMRGYIWDRTIPLLKKYFFLGSGPDTFIIAFPNSDLVGLYNSGHNNEIITKPHCMYLQVGVQTGVISLIALLIFFGWYLIDSLRLYWRCQYNQYLPLIGVGIFCAVIGYLILGLTNDSCIAISPIFYTLLGTGLGINHKIRTELAEVCILPKKQKKTEKEDSQKNH